MIYKDKSGSEALQSLDSVVDRYTTQHFLPSIMLSRSAVKGHAPCIAQGKWYLCEAPPQQGHRHLGRIALLTFVGMASVDAIQDFRWLHSAPEIFLKGCKGGKPLCGVLGVQDGLLASRDLLLHWVAASPLHSDCRLMVYDPAHRNDFLAVFRTSSGLASNCATHIRGEVGRVMSRGLAAFHRHLERARAEAAAAPNPVMANIAWTGWALTGVAEATEKLVVRGPATAVAMTVLAANVVPASVAGHVLRLSFKGGLLAGSVVGTLAVSAAVSGYALGSSAAAVMLTGVGGTLVGAGRGVRFLFRLLGKPFSPAITLRFAADRPAARVAEVATALLTSLRRPTDIWDRGMPVAHTVSWRKREEEFVIDVRLQANMDNYMQGNHGLLKIEVKAAPDGRITIQADAYPSYWRFFVRTFSLPCSSPAQLRAQFESGLRRVIAAVLEGVPTSAPTQPQAAVPDTTANPDATPPAMARSTSSEASLPNASFLAAEPERELPAGLETETSEPGLEEAAAEASRAAAAAAEASSELLRQLVMEEPREGAVPMSTGSETSLAGSEAHSKNESEALEASETAAEAELPKLEVMTIESESAGGAEGSASEGEAADGIGAESASEPAMGASAGGGGSDMDIETPVEEESQDEEDDSPEEEEGEDEEKADTSAHVGGFAGAADSFIQVSAEESDDDEGDESPADDSRTLTASMMAEALGGRVEGASPPARSASPGGPALIVAANDDNEADAEVDNDYVTAEADEPAEGGADNWVLA